MNKKFNCTEQSNLIMEVMFFFLILVIMCSIASSETDTLKQGDVLNSSESTFLVSPNKNFTLGFFTPKLTNNTYLAIRFTGWRSTEPVWIGNRENPLPKNSPAMLFIDASGRLILTPYQLSWKNTSLNVTASLLDSGNFVLREINAADGLFRRELWSSFDNPTDTLLPGMKLGVNHRTGRNWTLTSWLRDDAPAPDAFSLEWDPTRTRLVIKNRGVVRWTSGELMVNKETNGEAYFQHVRSYSYSSGQTFKYINISTKEEESFSFTVTLRNSKFGLAGWKLTPGGVLMDISGGVGRHIIDVGECYGYENETQKSKGCQLWEQPKCRGDGQTFEERSGSFVNVTAIGREIAKEFTTNISNDSLSDCRDKCWKDCDCVGYQMIYRERCTFWRGTSLQFHQDNSGITPQIFVLDRPIKEGNDSKSSSNSKKWLRIVVPTIVVVILAVLLGLLILRRRRKREEARKEQELKDLLTLEEYNDIIELSNGENGNLKVFSYARVVATTNNFSPDYKLGQGGFGSVYKGVTQEGQEVAIKQLSETSTQGLVEFKNEVVLIAKLQHTNLVKLLGFCVHGDQKILVYEFMPNKSLDFYLFDLKRKEYLTWEKRLNIIEGIAQGLLYLHKYSRLRIIHRDMKTSNILLDENMNPKISDFGMAKILRQNATEANTMRLGGTFGYMAPEYAMEGIFSTKSDVYSFGVLVLEIVSGKKNNQFRNKDGPLNLVEHAWELWNRDAVLQLVDPTIRNSCGNEEQLRRCINVGLLCVEDFATDRPSMSDVVSMLANENLALPQPKKPAFVSRFSVADGFQEGKSEKFTANELSISTMEGR